MGSKGTTVLLKVHFPIALLTASASAHIVRKTLDFDMVTLAMELSISLYVSGATQLLFTTGVIFQKSCITIPILILTLHKTRIRVSRTPQQKRGHKSKNKLITIAAPDSTKMTKGNTHAHHV